MFDIKREDAFLKLQIIYRKTTRNNLLLKI